MTVRWVMARGEGAFELLQESHGVPLTELADGGTVYHNGQRRRMRQPSHKAADGRDAGPRY